MNFFKIAIYKGDNHYKIENQDFRKTSYSSFEIPNDITFEDNKTSPRLTFIKCKFDDFTIHSNSYYTNDSFSYVLKNVYLIILTMNNKVLMDQ